MTLALILPYNFSGIDLTMRRGEGEQWAEEIRSINGQKCNNYNNPPPPPPFDKMLTRINNNNNKTGFHIVKFN